THGVRSTCHQRAPHENHPSKYEDLEPQLAQKPSATFDVDEAGPSRNDDSTHRSLPPSSTCLIQASAAASSPRSCTPPLPRPPFRRSPSIATSQDIDIAKCVLYGSWQRGSLNRSEEHTSELQSRGHV